MSSDSFDMAFPDFGGFPHFGEVPEDLHSTYLGGEFRQCSICDCALPDASAYEVQKVMRGDECVFEMAICLGCAQNLMREYSEESLAVLSGLSSRVTGRAPRGSCEFCSVPREGVDEYTSIAVCRAGTMLTPMITLCYDCVDSLHAELSQATRDTFGEFIRDNFPGVPEGLDLPVTSLV